jgi:hypothetical protein
MGKVRLRKQIRAEVELNAFSVEIARRPYTCVIAFAWRDGVLWSDAGFSKANWPDWYSEKLGVRIARGRALDGIVRQITGEKAREERLLTAEDLYQVAKLRILENSTQSVEAAILGPDENTEPLILSVVGAAPGEGPSPFTGMLDAVRVSNAVRDFEEKLEHVETGGGVEWRDSGRAPWAVVDERSPSLSPSVPTSSAISPSARSLEEGPLDQ